MSREKILHVLKYLLPLLKQISQVDEQVLNWNGLPEKTFLFVGHTEDSFKLWCLLCHCWKTHGLPGPAAGWPQRQGSWGKTPESGSLLVTFRD